MDYLKVVKNYLYT